MGGGGIGFLVPSSSPPSKALKMAFKQFIPENRLLCRVTIPFPATNDQRERKERRGVGYSLKMKREPKRLMMTMMTAWPKRYSENLWRRSVRGKESEGETRRKAWRRG